MSIMVTGRWASHVITIAAAAGIALVIMPSAQEVSAQGRASVPGRELALGLEKKIQLPQGARPLDSYARYYEFIELTRDMTALAAKEGERIVAATYVLADGSEHRPGIHLVSSGAAPFIPDGGCDVVTVLYNPRTQKMTEPTCNGEG